MVAARVIGKDLEIKVHYLNANANVSSFLRGGFAEEVKDHSDFRFTNTRRRSNSSLLSHHISEFKTKFDVNDTEPVFEEHIHGPLEEEDDDDVADDSSKTDASESGGSSS